MAKKETESETSVKSYQQSINSEKQRMGAYAKKMGTSVKSLQGEFKKHSKEVKEAGRNMIGEGIRNMKNKVGKFNNDIQDQIKENKASVSRMGDNIKYFLSEINKKKKDFKAYASGPFKNYIKAFWG